MDRSEIFVSTLDRVRGLPQNTIKQKERKREESRLLRMETFLDNAQCARFLTTSLEDKPDMTLGEFRELAQKELKVIFPDSVDAFIISLIQARNKVRLTVKDWADKPETLPESVFMLAQSDARQNPKGKIQLIDSYPLALIMGLTDPEDFKMINPNDNIGGFYQSTTPYRRRVSKKLPGNGIEHQILDHRYPLIVVNGSIKFANDPHDYKPGEKIQNIPHPSDLITAHEKNHAEHHAFMQTLKKTDRKVVWGRFDDPKKARKAAKKLEHEWQWQNPELARSSSDYKKVLNYAFYHAKDELLANINIRRINMLKASEAVKEKFESLKEKRGVYDYFFKDLDIGSLSAVYRDLWSSYEVILQNMTNKVIEILQIYEAGDLKGRMELFRLVLAQVPLEDWGKFIDNSLFSSEAQAFKTAYENMPFDQPEPTFGELPKHERSRQLHYTGYMNREFNAKDQLMKQCRDNPQKPFFIYIRQYNKAIARLVNESKKDPNLI